MTADSGESGGSFNLFDAEERILAAAARLQRRLTDADPELRQGVETLTEAYSRSVREQRRLVKVSDRLQNQMATLNQELARRRAEAEEALAQLKDAQETLVQAEKLASLGALVGGVAHEINTPVGIALSCASHLADATTRLQALFAADDIGIDDFETYLATATDTTRLIQANCERAATLIGSFKQVAVDRTSSERRTFELAGYIAETLASLSPKLRHEGHKVVIDCPAGIRMDGYPGALSQILTNLVMNSVTHGYDPGQSGTLRILVELPDADTIRLIYCDDGKGIPDEHRSRVFDPFFTTRRGSGGTGLGLHIVYNLATGPLQGALSLDSTPGDGTRFTLAFPRRIADKAQGAAPSL
jgi:two-component system NtrC family sensor kinase